MDSDPRRPPQLGTSLPLKLGLLGVSLLLAALASEVVLRLFFKDSFALTEAQQSLPYQYDPELGWFPIPNSQKPVTASRTFTAAHNSQGFRGPERAQNTKPAFIFLGDSLVWGFDAEASERFTEKLQAKRPQCNIYNFGVCGYGTDQEYVLLKKYFDQYRPSAVFLMICGDNDNEDNSWNFRGGYYKPWFTLKAGALKLNGLPVPKSEKVFLAEHKTICRSYLARLMVRAWCKLTRPAPKKNPDPPTGVLLLDMRTYVQSRGVFFAVGLQHSSPPLEKFLRDYKIPFVDLETTNRAHVYPKFGNHWTPAGHDFVAQKLDAFLPK